MRHRNWSQYNKKLVQRGRITFLIDPKILPKLNVKKIKGKLGRPFQYSDSLILLLLMVKAQFGTTYRALEGFSQSVLEKTLALVMPNYSLICKRAKTLKHALPKLSGRKPHTVLLDATGLKVVGEGEWKRKIHGPGRPRKWIKLHVAVDEATQEIVSLQTTESSKADVSCAKDLLDGAGKRVKRVIADGAYDSLDFRETVTARGASSLIPPPKNAKYKGTSPDRDDALCLIAGFGGGRKGRSLWGKCTGYSRRSLVETAFSRYKRLFGARMYSKTFDRQQVENYLKCYLLNKML